MVRLTESQLLRLIQESTNVEELDERVAHQYGSDHIPEARLRAVELCGAEWVFGHKPQPQSTPYKVGRVLGKPQNVVLWVSALLAALAVLYPPYVATVDGITYHMGFYSLFHEISAAKIGGVNTLLLCVELLAIGGIGGILYVLTARIEEALNVA
jgi:hypothetical protein